MRDQCTIKIFLDNETHPLGEFKAPINFELDTRKLTDGMHTLKIISMGSSGREGVRNIEFEVRNGPAIEVDGIHDNAVVDGILPLMVHAYSKGDQKKFLIEGSEVPRSIPAWLWVVIVLLVGWGMYYVITSLNMRL